MLIVLAGLPGAGKTTIARTLAQRIGAVHLRIDSIEQAIRDTGLTSRSLDDAGYRIAYAVAGDNLRIGLTVIADSVNPLQITRDAWVDVAKRIPAKFVEVEVMCSDRTEHRKRVETRAADVPGLRLPTWDEVVGREYHPWNRERVVVDTAVRRVEENVALLMSEVDDRRE
jgi:predicted kinase